MTGEQYSDFISGQMIILKHICAAMVALHPHRNTVFQLANNVLDNAVQTNAPEYYKNGIRDILEAVAEMLNSAVLAEQLPKKGLDTKH